MHLDAKLLVGKVISMNASLLRAAKIYPFACLLELWSDSLKARLTTEAAE